MRRKTMCKNDLWPDATLMDLRMPRLGGVEAIEAIRGIDPEAHILVLTTYGGDEEIYCALQAGACAYILKDAEPRSCSARSELSPRGTAHSFDDRSTAGRAFCRR
jgi:DNA-binding NarL/FixJ family response regulator